MSQLNAQKLHLISQSNELNKSKLLKRKLNDENNPINQPKHNGHSYEEENIKRVKREPLKSIENILVRQNVSPIKIKEPILKPQYDTSLNMKCYSDPDYDWILNNLESNYIPNELENKLNDSFENILTVTREAKIEYKQDKLSNIPFDLYDEHELEMIKEKENSISKDTSKVITNNSKEKTLPSVQKKSDVISLIKTVKNNNPENEEYEFAVELLKKSFTANEIQTGIFGDKNNLSRSKTQTPFDYYKVEKFKETIAKKFNFDHNKMELVWTFLRTKLNVKLASVRKILIKSKDSN